VYGYTEPIHQKPLIGGANLAADKGFFLENFPKNSKNGAKTAVFVASSPFHTTTYDYFRENCQKPPKMGFQNL
jgi:hypothetical protein